jgi:flavin-dependent dehydrogenase
MEKRILIIGGGPAGCSAGIFLRKAGFDVTLFEKGGESREKVCGDGLTPESQNMLGELGVLEKVKSSALEVHSMKLFDLDGNPISFSSQCYTLKRSVLDRILRDELASLGGKVLYKNIINKVQVFEDEVVAENTENQKYEGDVVILATGAETSLAKNMGFEQIKDPSMVLLRGYIENNIGCNSLDFYFHKDFLHCGAWVFPLPNGVLNVGVGSPTGLYSSKNIDELMGKFFKMLERMYGKKIGQIGNSKKWIINAGLNSKNIYSDRVILCGENIHSAYSFSGEGVAPALKTGYYAASTIIEAKEDYSKNGLSGYKGMVERGIGPTHNIYNKMYWFLGKKLGMRVVCWFLKHSGRAKKLVEAVINEEVPLKKGFWSAIWYSRKL